MTKDPDRFWNPYLAGVALGLVLLATYLLTGKGLGASGASFRLAAGEQGEAGQHFALIQTHLRGLRPLGSFVPFGQAGKQPALGLFGLGNPGG